MMAKVSVVFNQINPSNLYCECFRNHYFTLQSCAENEEEEEEEEGKEKTFEVLNSWILIEVTKNNKIILILKMHMTIHGL